MSEEQQAEQVIASGIRVTRRTIMSDMVTSESIIEGSGSDVNDLKEVIALAMNVDQELIKRQHGRSSQGDGEVLHYGKKKKE